MAYLTATYADTFWLLMMGILVFFMQCGFGMLEAGTVRAKNTKNILLKNLLDACIGAIVWWAVGYGIAYDGNNNKFIGTTKSGGNMFFLKGEGLEGTDGLWYAKWWFQYVFAATAATIVSGAMAERTALTAYLIYTTIIVMLIYPVVAHWVWSDSGWVSTSNYHSGDLATFKGGCIDFAGSGVVHMTGGAAALVGAATVGPRKGRFDENKKPLGIPGHSTVLQVMGTFILWFGWYGFNPGSTLGISAANLAGTAARVVVTTTLSATAGGITAVSLGRAINKTWDVGMCCNGILGGLVSITAGCSVVLPWCAFIIGIFGGLMYVGASKLVLLIMKIDDPLDAFAVHGACGFWGVIAAGCFANPKYTEGVHHQTKIYAGSAGLFYGKVDSFKAALAATFAELAWVVGMSACMFVPMKAAGILRVSAEVEEMGMDVSKHGGAAYDHGN